MKIRTQFIISTIFFGLILLMMAAALAGTNLQIARVSQQEEISSDVEREARELSYLSNDYLLHRESQQQARWEAKFASLAADLAQLNPATPEQRALVNNIKANQQRLQAVFNDVVAALGSTPGEPSLNLVQVSWSRMEVQTQGMVFDALRLTQLLHEEDDQLKQTTITLIFALVVIFGAYLVTSYLITYRRTLKSISALQAGTGVIGTGNLDFILDVKQKDEVGELAQAFNRMTASLKEVTASRAELEREIEERKKAEEKATKIAEEWKTTFDSITDMVSIHDKDYKLVRVNKAYENAVKMSQAELVGKRCYEVVHDTACPIACCPQEQTLKTKKSVTSEMFEPRLGVYLEATTSPIFDRNGEVVGTVHIAKDITERKRMEERLEAQERLAYLGKMAGTIAHEIRNPLAVIDSSAVLLGKTLPNLEGKTRTYLERMRIGVYRAATIIEKLLEHARMRPPRMERLELKDFLKGLVSKGIPRTVRVELKLPEDGLAVRADAEQMRLALDNILRNAVEAMDKQGTLTVSAGRADKQAEISITDTGPGIPPENMDKIFQPLFTTKQGGVGFGLAMVKAIVERHGGTVAVRSEPGQGATFVIRLPEAENGEKG